MLYKPLVALFMAFAAAGGVAASTTPVRRGGNGGHPTYPPPPGPTIPVGNCNKNTELLCCNSLASTSDPTVALLSGVVGLVPNVLAALDCVPIGVLNPTCQANSVCCENTSQNGLVNVGCTQVNL